MNDLKSLLIASLLVLSLPLLKAQDEADSGSDTHLTGAVTVSTKGISTIPNLTLGKPAAIFDLDMGGEKFTFEPQFRFSLEGKPWSFLFWFRYQLADTEKFSLRTGVHPALSFKSGEFDLNGDPTELLYTRRYLAAELAPSWKINSWIGISSYLLYSYGVEEYISKNHVYIALGPSLSLPLGSEFRFGLVPQVYYLAIDDMSGTYFNTNLSLSKSGFPVRLTSVLNKSIATDIPSEYDFLWNISLVWTFNAGL